MTLQRLCSGVASRARSLVDVFGVVAALAACGTAAGQTFIDPGVVNGKRPTLPVPGGATVTPAADCDGDPLELLVPFDQSDGTWTEILPANDDGSAQLPLGFTFTLYDTEYTEVFVNNNGNLTFTTGLSAFSAAGFPDASIPPMVAPFWGDVDTRDPASGTVWHKFLDANTLVVTWDNVGHYDQQVDRLNTFQVIISSGSPLLGAGRNVGFSYSTMCWTTGDASLGAGGFGGIPATVGVNAGDGTNFIQIGRFSQNSDAYDGPFGDEDGVSYLNNRQFFFDVSRTNVPPVPSGLPVDNLFLVDSDSGSPFAASVSFLAPEAGQMVSVEVTENEAADRGLSITTTDGDQAEVEFAWSPDCCDQGDYAVTLVATDTAGGVTEETLTFRVLCSDSAPVADAGGPYVFECNGSTSGHAVSALSSSDVDSATLTYFWESTCPGVSFDDPTLAEPTIFIDTASLCVTGDIVCEATVTVSDGTCTDVATATIRLEDTAGPVVASPAPIVLLAEVFDGGLSALPADIGSLDAMDACSSEVVIDGVRDDGGDVFGRYPVGTTVVTWTVSDACGNATEVTQEVIVDRPPLPDLIVTDIQAPVTASESSVVSITYTVTNSGDGAVSGSWTDRLTFGPGQVQIATAAVSRTVAAGASYTGTVDATLPAGVFETRNVEAVTDAGNAVFEFNLAGDAESNNALVDDETLTILPPDLTVASADVPSVVTLSEPESISFTVANAPSGGDAVRDWEDRVYASFDGTFSPSTDLLLTTLGRPNTLAAGDSYLQTASATVPFDGTVAPGFYNVFIQTDAGGTQPESDNGNNVFGPVAIEVVEPPRPDLVVTMVESPSETIAGEEIEVTWRVENVGDAPAVGPFDDSVVLSTSADLSGVVSTMGTFEAALTLQPGDGFTRTEIVRTPGTPGMFRVLVRTDSVDVVDEGFDEGNNFAAAPGVLELTPTPIPDLIVTSITPPSDGVLSGQTTLVTYTVQNVGTGSTSSPVWTDTVFVSADPDLDFGGNFPDQEICGAAEFGPFAVVRAQNPTFLPPGGSYSNTVEFTLPSDVQGPFYIYVITDRRDCRDVGGNVAEVDNTNNILASPLFRIDLEPQPDLQVVGVSVPSIAQSANPIEIDWTTNNAGGGATETGSWTERVFLSLDNNPLISDGDLQIGQRSRGGLVLPPMTADAATSLTVTIPPEVSGTYFAKVLVDAGDSVSELGNEGNNVGVSADPVEIALSPTPDLFVQQPTVSSSGSRGYAIGVTYSVFNIGAEPLVGGGWTDRVFLSEDETLDAGDLPLGDASASTTLQGGVLTIEPYSRTVSATIPPDLAPGSYFVIVCVDNGESLFEIDGEANNVAVSEALTVVALASDLAMQPGANPASSPADAPVDLAFTVENVGGAPTNVSSWVDAVFLSIDMTRSSDDALLGASPRSGGLGVDGAYTSELTVQIPDVDAGSYFLIYVADRDGQVFEEGAESNNEVVVPFTVDPSGIDFFADLTVETLSVPSSAAAGSTVSVSYTVRNLGGVSAGGKGWTDRIVLSSDGIADGGDTPLAFVNRTAAVASQGVYTETRDVDLPPNVTGTRFVLVETDAFGGVFEFEEGNNTRSSSIALQGPPPPVANLIASGVSASGSGEAGSSIEVSFSIENIGPVGTGVGSRASVYASLDGQAGPGARLLGAVDIPALGSGEDAVVSRPFPLPLNLAAGEYFAVVAADSQNRVNEGAAENDNIAASVSPFSVTEPPRADLVVASVAVPSGGDAGQPASFSWTIENAGPGETRAGGWTDGVFLSRDRFFSRASDIEIGRVSSNDAIDPGGTVPLTRELQLPSGVSGEYFVIVQTDLDDREIEGAGEGNNVLISDESFTITLPPPADLVVESISAPSNGLVGDVLTFDYVLRNDGSAPASGSWTDRLYLSADAVWDVDDTPIGDVGVTGAALEGGATDMFSLTAAVPAVAPASYFVVARADVRNQINETDNANNTGASLSTIDVNVPLLVLGVPDTFDLPNTLSVYRRFDVGEGETVRVTLDHMSPGAWAELYIARDRVPTVGSFDFSFDVPAQPSQTVTIPITEAGTYFVLCRVSTGAQAGALGATLLAEALPFGVTSVFPPEPGRGETVTLEIDGSRFRGGSAVRLERPLPDSGLEVIDPTSVSIVAGDLILATFDLTAAETAAYDVVVIDPTLDEARLVEAVTPADPLPLLTSVDVIGPDSVRVGSAATYSVIVRNLSNVDIPHAIVNLSVLDDGSDTLIIPQSNTTLELYGETVDTSGISTAVRGEASTGLLDSPFLLTGIRPGSEVEIDFLVVFPGDRSAGPFNPGAVVQPLDAEAFADYVLGEIEAVREGLLINPASVFADTGDPMIDAFIGDLRNELALAAQDGPAFTLGVLENLVANGLVNVLYDDDAFMARGFDLFLFRKADLNDVVQAGAAGAAAVIGGTIAIISAPATVPAGLVIAGAVIAAGAAGFNFGWKLGDFLTPDPPSPCGGGGGSGRGSITHVLTGDELDDTTWRFHFAGGGEESLPAASVGFLRESSGKCNPGDCKNPIDPNEKTGPFGFDEGFVNYDPVRYQVFFENLPEVTANAAIVRVVDEIDPDLNIGSFRLGDIEFGPYRVEVPAGRNFFQTVVDLTDDPDRNVLLEITAGVNAATREAFWEFTSIDPATDDVPVNPLEGFLPPNVESPEGEGSVVYFVAPSPIAPTGTELTNDATIIFDTQPSITTNEIVLRVDGEAPVSSVTGLPRVTEGTEIDLTWSGEDLPGGSGLATFEVFVSIDGAAAVPLTDPTTEQSGTLIAPSTGAVVSFFSVATDGAGNVEPLPATPDAVTALPSVDLAEASDTGPVGDGITADNTPAFLAVSAPMTEVGYEFVGPSGPVSGAFMTGANGRGAFEIVQPLANGEYTVSTTLDGVTVSTTITIEASPLMIESWGSLATHTGFGAIPIDLPSDGSGVEPRGSGVTELLLTFVDVLPDAASVNGGNVVVTGVDNTNAAIDLSGVMVDATLDAPSNAVRVTFSPALPDEARYCVDVSGFVDGVGNAVDSASALREITALRGDANGDLRVNNTDVGGVVSLRNTDFDPMNPLSVRSDVTLDGRINNTDVGAVVSVRGADVRDAASPCGSESRLGGRDLPGVHGFGEATPFVPGRNGGNASRPATRRGGIEPGAAIVDLSNGVSGLVLGGSERDALEIDTSRLAVFDPAGLSVTASRIAELGLPVVDVVEHAMPGWSVITLEHRGVGAQLSAAHDLASAGLFASPVTLDRAGDAVVSTPRLLVTADGSVAVSEVLREIDPGVVVIESGFVGFDGVWLVDSSATTGFGAADIARAISEREGIEAEVDAIFSASTAATRGVEALASKVDAAAEDSGGTGLVAVVLGGVAGDGVVRMDATGFAPGDDAVWTRLRDGLSMTGETIAVSAYLPAGREYVTRTSWLVEAMGLVRLSDAEVVVSTFSDAYRGPALDGVIGRVSLVKPVIEAAAADFVAADIDRDGRVTVDDLRIVVDAVAVGESSASLDLDGDGRVDWVDVLEVSRGVVGADGPQR